MDSTVARKLKKKSRLMKDKDIKRIIGEETEGYELLCYDVSDTAVGLMNPANNSTMEIVIGINSVCLTKNSNDIYEVTTINDNFCVDKIYLEKKDNGVILKYIDIVYDYVDGSKKERYPISILQKEYFIEKEKLIDNGSYDNIDIRRLFTDKLESMDTNTLSGLSYYKSSFETYMKYYITGDNLLYHNYTYSDEKNISHLYDGVRGDDMLFRIYDLYNGIINDRNIKDVKKINSGLLYSEGFGYRNLLGINEKEDMIFSACLEAEQKMKYSYNINSRNILNKKKIKKVI